MFRDSPGNHFLATIRAWAGQVGAPTQGSANIADRPARRTRRAAALKLPEFSAARHFQLAERHYPAASLRVRVQARNSVPVTIKLPVIQAGALKMNPLLCLWRHADYVAPRPFTMSHTPQARESAAGF